MKPKEMSTLTIEEVTNNDREILLGLNSLSSFREFVFQLSEKENPLLSILLSSSLAIELDFIYINSEKLWWEDTSNDEEAIEYGVENELSPAIEAATKIRDIEKTAQQIKSEYISEADEIFILVDLANIAAYAELPYLNDSLEIEDLSKLPRASYYKGRQQMEGFKGGKTAHAVTKPGVKMPRSGCLSRAYKNASAALDTKDKLVSNGLTMQAVESFPNHIVITGTVENNVSIVGQYDDEVISPQEYILQVMYGVFSNEPVVALENKE